MSDIKKIIRSALVLIAAAVVSTAADAAGHNKPARQTPKQVARAMAENPAARRQFERYKQKLRDTYWYDE